MGNEYFGTPQEIEEARAKRRLDVQAWGQSVIDEADRAKFGDTAADWDDTPAPIAEPVVEQTEPEEPTESKVVTTKSAPKPSSKESSDAK